MAKKRTTRKRPAAKAQPAAQPPRAEVTNRRTLTHAVPLTFGDAKGIVVAYAPVNAPLAEELPYDVRGFYVLWDDEGDAWVGVPRDALTQSLSRVTPSTNGVQQRYRVYVERSRRPPRIQVEEAASVTVPPMQRDLIVPYFDETL